MEGRGFPTEHRVVHPVSTWSQGPCIPYDDGHMLHVVSPSKGALQIADSRCTRFKFGLRRSRIRQGAESFLYAPFVPASTMLETCLTSAGHLVQKEDATGQCPHSSTVAWMVGWVGEVRDGGPMGRGATWGVGGPMGRGARWGSWWPAGDRGRTRSVRGTRGANGPGRILRGHADTRDEGVAGREGTVGLGTIGGGGRKARGTAEVCL